MRKPKLSPEMLVSKMKNEKGITFEYMNEKAAIEFLKKIIFVLSSTLQGYCLQGFWSIQTV